jgi:hypothetical protein
LAAPAGARAAVELEPAGSPAGYVARLLINESPFPGEMGYVSEENTKATMLAILWVVDSRLKRIPKGYSQKEIAAVDADDVIDVITAGGVKGQCDGFYRDAKGVPTTVPRVGQRVDNLVRISSQGTPGRFARLLNYAQGLASAYMRGGVEEADRFAALSHVSGTPVTGRAYSWMTDRDYYSPGGNFVKIPNADGGVLGGNRFFTLKKR